MKRLWITLLLLITAACTDQTITPTPTVNWPTAKPSLAPSPTVNVIMPEGDGQGAAVIGSSNPTQAALAAEGQPDRDLPTITPRPTEPSLPMSISTTDGLVLQGTYYSSPVRPAPGVLMLHMIGRDRSSWDELAQRMQAQGFAVLTVDLRGYGATGGDVDWTLAQSDVHAVVNQFAGLPGVDASNIIVIGASIGANLGVNACADYAGCKGAVMLSPGLDYRGISAPDAMARMGARAVLIAASENDNNNPADSISLDRMAAGAHRLVIYPSAGHGTDMFAVEPALTDVILSWANDLIFSSFD